MKKVFVTGGAGYIGDCAVEYLLDVGCKVTILDSLMYGGAYLRQHENLTFVRGDIRNQDLVGHLIEQNESVLHLAAIVGDGACGVNIQETIDVNELATKYIAEECRKNNKRMVFASTCSVYGANNDELDENSPTNPLSAYAGTKLRAEEFVREVPEHFIFRLGTLFGLGTEHARLRCDLVVNILTYKACSGQVITVFGGEQWRPLLHVRDAGEIMARATISEGIRLFTGNEPGQAVFQLYPFWGTYILSKDNYRIIDVARTIQEALDISDGSVEVTDLRFEDQRNYRVSSNRYGRVFTPTRTLQNGILEMANVMEEGRIANVWDSRFHNARYVSEKK